MTIKNPSNYKIVITIRSTPPHIFRLKKVHKYEGIISDLRQI